MHEMLKERERDTTSLGHGDLPGRQGPDSGADNISGFPPTFCLLHTSLEEIN